MESFDVLISAAHHASVDIPQPIRMGGSHSHTKDYHYRVSESVAEYSCEGKCYEHGDEEHHQLDDELQRVLEVALRRNLLVERQRLLVIHSQLEE